jgi:Flp pilus assembly protein TadG
MRLLSHLQACKRGVMAIESVVVAPILILLALGAFQVGSMVSRQQELQSGAADVEAIILAAAQSSGAAVSSTDIEQVVEQSLGLDASEVTLAQRYRCGTGPLVTADVACVGGQQRYEFVLLQLTDTYVPFWTSYGVGAPFTYTVNRTIQIQ